MGGYRVKNDGISTILHTAYRESLSANQWCRWKLYAPKLCLLGVSTHHISTTPNGEPQTQNNFWVTEIHFIHHIWHTKIYWIQWWNFFLSSNLSTIMEISPENSVHGWLRDKRKWLSPENCFWSIAMSNWCSLSIKRSSFHLYLTLCRFWLHVITVIWSAWVAWCDSPKSSCNCTAQLHAWCLWH